MADNESAEVADDYGQGPGGPVSRWLAEIKAYEQTFSKWIQRCPRIIERYRDETPGGDAINAESGRFNVLWSNIQTLQPALYSKIPKPEVARRYRDRDPIGRAAAEILERALEWSIDSYDFNNVAESVRDDFLLCARGQAWARYVANTSEETTDRIPLTADDQGVYRDEEGGVYEESDEDEDGIFAMSEPYKPVEGETVESEFINWQDFGHTPAPRWTKVTAVWKRELMTRKQLIKRFGKEIGDEVGMTKSVKGTTSENHEAFGDVFKRAEVYEIWDKDTMQAIWVSPGYLDKPLDIQDDPLGLAGFFPCPAPLFGTITTDNMIPVPDYAEYQAQAMELDDLSSRIKILTKALKVAGFYAGDKSDEIEGAIKGADNVMIPVANWAMISERGGMEKLIAWFPVEQVSNVLVALVNMREQIKKDLYELTGMSDIVRGQGQTKTGVTATEQKIKGQYAALRLQERKSALGRFLRDLLRIKAEMIVEHLDPKTISDMTGWMLSPEAEALDRAHEDAKAKAQQVMQEVRAATMAAMQSGQPPPPIPETPIPLSAQQTFDQAIELLKNDRLRTFRIDIETDSTIIEDQEAEKEARTQFITGVGSFLKDAMPAVAQEPALGPILGEMLLFSVRGWKTGRQMEASLETAMDFLRNAPTAEKGPSPEQMEQKRQEADAQRKQEADLAKQAADQARAAADTKKHEVDLARLEIEKAEATAAATMRESESMAAENDRQRAHEIRLKELEIRKTEADVRIEEVKIRPVQNDRAYALDRDKLLDTKTARTEEHQFQKEIRTQDRQAAVEDRSDDRQAVIEDRKEDRRATASDRSDDRKASVEDRNFAAEQPTDALDKQMGKISETLLATAAKKVADTVGETGDKQGDRQTEMIKKMDDNHKELIETMIRALTAPRVLERDAQGRPTGAKVTLQ